MISPVDVSTSVCLSRDADDGLCKHPALTLPRNPVADRQLCKLSSFSTALAIALATVNWDKTQQVLCPSRICQVSSLDCESVLDRLAPSSPAPPCPATVSMQSMCVHLWKKQSHGLDADTYTCTYTCTYTYTYTHTDADADAAVPDRAQASVPSDLA